MHKYDPRKKLYNELLETFVCGDKILTELLNDIKPEIVINVAAYNAKELVKLGHDVTVFTPLYEPVEEDFDLDEPTTERKPTVKTTHPAGMTFKKAQVKFPGLTKDQHQSFVKQQLKVAEDLPAEVLKEYPHLQKQVDREMLEEVEEKPLTPVLDFLGNKKINIDDAESLVDSKHDFEGVLRKHVYMVLLRIPHL